MVAEEPLVSVVISCYNHQDYISAAIQSVIDQDYRYLELIIIDDGSQDGSVQEIQRMIRACNKRFVRFEFRNRDNKGLAVSLNESLKWAQGKYFSVIASDDLMEKHKISSLVNKLEHIADNYAVAFGDASFIDNDGERLMFDIKVKNEQTSTNSFSELYAVRRNFDYHDLSFLVVIKV